MKASRLARNIAILCGGVLSADPSFAADSLLSVGNSTATSGSSLTVNTGDHFLVDFEAGKSYSCEGIPVSPTTLFDFDTTVAGTTGGTPPSITARSTGALTPPITGESGDSANNRLSFIVTTADRYQLTVAAAEGGGETIRPRCLETTLYGGYNTNVNDFNFLELTNVSSAAITGKITATNFDGTTVINGQSFTVPAGQRIDIDVHTPAGADKFGSIRVAHDGSYGSLQANLSQYAGSVSNFALSASLPLRPIEQNP